MGGSVRAKREVVIYETREILLCQHTTYGSEYICGQRNWPRLPPEGTASVNYSGDDTGKKEAAMEHDERSIDLLESRGEGNPAPPIAPLPTNERRDGSLTAAVGKSRGRCSDNRARSRERCGNKGRTSPGRMRAPPKRLP